MKTDKSYIAELPNILVSEYQQFEQLQNSMKKNFKLMIHNIEQLKDEITNKDYLLVKEHFNHHKVEKEKDYLNNELTRIKKQISNSEQILSNQKNEILKLTNIINDAQTEESRQLKEYKNIVYERDTLRSQLMSRQNEIKKLYEKMKILKSTLTKGYEQYKQRENEINELNELKSNLINELKQINYQLKDEKKLKNEINKLSTNLLQEEIKIRALSEEYERPLNIHRWRNLEGKDPKRYDMIKTIHKLQKQLIENNDKLNEKKYIN